MDINPFWLIFCIVAPLAGIIIFGWGFLEEKRKSAKKIEDTKAQYQEALSNLQANPENEFLFQEAFRKGTTYADLVQFDKRDDFTEDTLLDQLNAARPGAPSLQSIKEVKKAEPTHPSAVKLAELKEMREKGLITNAEYHEKRVKILEEF